MYLIKAIKTTRPPFLLLTPVCIGLGVATAQFEQGSINILYAILALIGGLAAHIGVNTFNEYFDYKSGLDLKTNKTPFSGGSGVLPANPDAANTALSIAIVSQVVLFAIGLYFVSIYGVDLIPLGLLGMIIVFAYTQWITRHPVICLIAPGLGVGPLMVIGTHFVLTGSYSLTALLASLVVFFLANNLLLLNQLPDIEPDRAVGRRHIPALYGAKFASRLYVIQLILSYFALVIAVLVGYLPMLSLVALITLFLAIPSAKGALYNWNNIEKLMPSMGMNVAVNLITPILIATGLIFQI